MANNDVTLVEFKEDKINYTFYLGPKTNWGNPWDYKLQNNGFEVNSEEEATENFRKWIWGEDFLNTLQRKRKWILLNLKYLKNKKIAYSNKKYAEILVNAIDQNIEIPNIDILPNEGKVKSIF